MSLGPMGTEREIRAARNQSVFRAVNEKLKGINAAFESIVGRHEVVCECADLDCVETIEISREEYGDVREKADRFVVLAAHVYPDVERVVGGHDGYVVVEKTGVAGETARAERAGDA